ncbi:MAG: hypothetical protein DMG38_09400 [Acidobacteria bacterium]|nr:MAG: hypothetical protein DMG38_09400 [Acidobacteriota bacterium]
MHWWILISIAAAILVALNVVFRWASRDGGMDADIPRHHFRAEQDWRGLHRSPIDGPDRHR